MLLSLLLGLDRGLGIQNFRPDLILGGIQAIDNAQHMCVLFGHVSSLNHGYCLLLAKAHSTRLGIISSVICM